MDSDSDSPFNYSWPSFPKMRMRKKTGKKGKPRIEAVDSFPPVTRDTTVILSVAL